MTERLVTLERPRNGLAVVSLNRPDKRNALNVDLLRELLSILEICEEDDKVRVIILRGEGAVFCAGLDLKEALNYEQSTPSAKLLAKLYRTLAESSAVTIAAAQGAALAGGAGLMLACDFAVAAEGTRFGFPEVHRGLVAGLVMTFLRRRISEGHARELLLLGDAVDSTRALEMGLISRVVPENQLMAMAETLAVAALKGGPRAVANTKGLFAQLWHSSVADDLEQAANFHKEARTSVEAMEGMAAFLEKRPPNWQA